MQKWCLCLIFLILAFPAHAEKPLLLVTNEYLPYVSTSKDSNGFLGDVVLAAFAEAGIPVVIEYRPWRRCAMLVEEGAAFGAFPYAVTEKRKRYAWFSDEMWRCRNVFFYLRGRFGNYDFTSLKALQGHSIAGTSGNYYEEAFRKAGLDVDYAPGEASGVRKLWELRTDFFAEDELVGWTLIARLFPKSIFMFGATPTPWNENPQTLMVSKRYPGAQGLLARFNAGLKAIRENGVYRELFERHFSGTPLVPR